MNNESTPCPLVGKGLSRRAFLRRSGGATITLLIAGVPGVAGAVDSRASGVPAWIAEYEKIRVVRVADLVRHETLYFEYPDENSSCFLVQMEVEAGGGVGPGKDIVAFHTSCTHMGGPLHGAYKKEYAAVGPCPSHLTTFDLQRHGMVIAGHATESLPQVVLEVEGEWIYATGMMGLVFGRTANVTE